MHPAVRPITLAVLALGTAGGALTAQEQPDSARIVDRMDARDVDHAMVTNHGDVALLIDDSDVVIQLTDAGLRAIDTADVEEEDEGLGTRLLGAMIRAGVRELLDHGIAYPIDRLARAEVVDGRLVLEDRNGDQVFDLDINGRDVMADFPAEQARDMAREIRARM